MRCDKIQPNENLPGLALVAAGEALVTRGATGRDQVSSNRCHSAARRKFRTPNSALRTLFWCVPFLLAGLCFWQALPGPRSDSTSSATAAVLPPTGATSSPATKRTVVTRPIQEIQVGQRVLAENPELRGSKIDDTKIDPSTWRRIRLSMQKPDDSQIEITLLRSIDWLDENDAAIGESIELDLVELGADGPANVLAIEPCPALAGGDGRIVTGTFAHSAKQVIDVHVSEMPEPIGCTPNHPFWSEDRQEFVPAGELRVGEALMQVDGRISRVTSLDARSATEPVFNLEVDVEHAYFVSSSGILVHNACVYQSVAGKIREYIGITNNPIRRAAEHLRDGRVIQVIKGLEDITRKQARAIEHLLIEKYGRMANGTGTLSNINRGIDPAKLGKYRKQLAWAADKLHELGVDGF